ncbi:hybrid sensor histidine kinase/response regulator [Rivihabitans pingtungensis]|jgi:PAS domain S-box-containing protein|uniref:hybrid sensor histidine kinase/response regulator n=1 Tax=Rivihabitans pingtungensis TaxID=1054498 RepID=UPI0023552B19|nr:NahK/ErcS family hybrid sensor histidine kinase/response regulator [Rivihabitans pingtungensis]MCK6437630.1 PAS-domain containing protein [Rivihabitans pingtungensis]
MNDVNGDALRLAALERENAKLKKINAALMRRVEQGLADNGNSFTFFQVAVELEHRIQERTRALEQAMAELEAANFALTQAKRAAETAQGRLDVAVDTIADGFALWQPDDTLARCNRRFLDLFPNQRGMIRPGLHFEDFVAAVVSDGGVLEARDDPFGWLQRRVAYHREPEGSLILSMADGTWQRISERRTGDGGRVGIYTDITDIKRQEMRLRESDLAAHSLLLQATLNSIRQGIAVFDAHGALLAWNHRFSDLVGLSPQALAVGKRISPRERTLCCPLSGALEMAGTRGRTLEVQYNPMPNGGFAMTYTDISERKAAEQALRDSEAKMRLITDALPALIAYVDNQQIYRFTNQGYEDWFGIPRSEINGRPMREVLGPRLFDGRRHYVERALEGRASVFELELPAPRRNIEFAKATFIPHFDPDHGGVLGFFALIQDITDIRRAARALEHSKEQLEQRVAERTIELSHANSRLQEAIHAAEEAQRSKTRFFAAASHDLLQPLNAARLFLASLAGQPLPPNAARLADNAGASLEAVDDLINTLLEISRLDAGAVETDMRHFPVAALLDQLATEFAPLAEARGLSLRLHNCAAVVHSDWVLLGRVLRNFLSNAIRYTRHGSLLLGCRRIDGGVRVGVWDQGAGIEPEKLPTIFGEFVRLSEHSSMCNKGMGLGLAIVHRLARALQHRLYVRSIPGQGSCFAIDIPYGRPAAVQFDAPHDDAPSANHPAQTGDALLLLIDNDPAILEGMVTLLEDWDYQTLAASSAEAALTLLDAHGLTPDAILADYHLDDGATGSEAIRRICQHLGQNIPAALITADRSAEVRQEAEAAGWAWLGKPVRPARLRALLGHVLRRGEVG